MAGEPGLYVTDLFFLSYKFHLQTVWVSISDMYHVSCILLTDYVEDLKAYELSASGPLRDVLDPVTMGFQGT